MRYFLRFINFNTIPAWYTCLTKTADILQARETFWAKRWAKLCEDDDEEDDEENVFEKRSPVLGSRSQSTKAKYGQWPPSILRRN